MSLLKRQREILVGLVLGDGFIQKIGKRSARIRLEHSIKQKDYIFWKYKELENMMQSRPKLITRYNPVYKKTYQYYRCQSHSSPEIGKLHRLFYENSKKRVPQNINRLLRTPLTLAVWYMDDGYYYPRDNCAYIYLPLYEEDDIKRLLVALNDNFGLRPKVLTKKGKYKCLWFNHEEFGKLVRIIEKEIIPSMRYKIPHNPVSTEDALSEDPQKNF